MDWSRLPQSSASRRSTHFAAEDGTLLRARPPARAPADRLQPRQGGRVARRLAELGNCRSRQREMAQARSSASAGARGLNETHLQTSADGADSVWILGSARQPGSTRSSAGARSRCHHLVVPTAAAAAAAAESAAAAAAASQTAEAEAGPAAAVGRAAAEREGEAVGEGGRKGGGGETHQAGLHRRRRRSRIRLPRWAMTCHGSPAAFGASATATGGGLLGG
jgi:hypothetical protein